VLDGAHLVIIDDLVTIVLVPDPDAEPIRNRTWGECGIYGADLKAIVAQAIDRAHTFVHRLGARYHKPVVAFRVKVQAPGLELEFGVAGWCRGAFLVLGQETEGRPAAQTGIGPVCACRRVDPTAAGDKAAVRVVDHRQRADRV